MKNHFPTLISLGNPALFQIVSSIHPKDGNGAYLFETTSLILEGVQLGNSDDFEVAGVTSSDLVVCAELFSTMAKNRVVSRKRMTLQLGSNFNDYWVRMHQISFLTLGFDILNRQNESILSNHKVSLNYFSLLCHCYYDFVQSFKKLFTVRSQG